MTGLYILPFKNTTMSVNLQSMENSKCLLPDFHLHGAICTGQPVQFRARQGTRHASATIIKLCSS